MKSKIAILVSMLAVMSIALFGCASGNDKADETNESPAAESKEGILKLDEPIVIQDDENAYVAITEFEECKYYDGDTYQNYIVKADIENRNADKDFTVQLTDVAVNGYSLNGSSTEQVLSGTKAKGNMYICAEPGVIESIDNFLEMSGNVCLMPSEKGANSYSMMDEIKTPFDLAN